MLSTHNSLNDLEPCYFSIRPSHYNDCSIETPCYSPASNSTDTIADPTHPLLAFRPPQPSPPSSPLLRLQSAFFQMQNASAHGHGQSRPRPYPVQNVLHVTSDDSESSGSSSSSSSSSAKSSLDIARCSRCQRTGSSDVNTGKSNMVQYGLNLWYCNRCAGMVGLKPR